MVWHWRWIVLRAAEYNSHTTTVNRFYFIIFISFINFVFIICLLLYATRDARLCPSVEVHTMCKWSAVKTENINIQRINRTLIAAFLDWHATLWHKQSPHELNVRNFDSDVWVCFFFGTGRNCLWLIRNHDKKSQCTIHSKCCYVRQILVMPHISKQMALD